MVAPPYDLLVIGGGINGTGIARDAAGRGLRVLLAEQNDLASATSSESSGWSPRRWPNARCCWRTRRTSLRR